MNAYELAEKAQGLAYEIPADWSSGEPKNVATDIANMLRQQADRIAELEKDLAVKTRDRDVFSNFTLAYEKRIAELEKEKIRAYDNGYEDGQKSLTTNAEPVAWMDTNGVPSSVKSELYLIPLYTTPQTKPLSDEEIGEIISKYRYENDLKVLCRAIEERHGIK